MTKSISTILFMVVCLYRLIKTSEQTLPITSEVCPDPSVRYDPGYCLFTTPVELNYCDAHRVCKQFGVLERQTGFLAGGIFQNVVNFTCSNCWTGLNRLSLDTNERPDVFFVVDPNSTGITINRSQLHPQWHAVDGRILALINDELVEQSQVLNGTHTLAFGVCQIVNISEAIGQHEPVLFKLEHSTRKHMQSDSFDGCPEVVPAPTKIACAMKCRVAPNCRSFTFHPVVKECHLSIHVDSKLPKSTVPTDRKWLDYVMQDGSLP